MLIVRLIGVLLIIAVGTCFLAYALTRNPRHLSLARALMKYALFAALGFFALLALERVLIL